MNPLSCALSARQAGEALIGTAGHYQAYVFIECPVPWPTKALDSRHIPLALRQYVKAVEAQRSVRFLCISRGKASAPARTVVLVYERTDRLALNSFSAGFANRYDGQEFQVESLDQVVTCLETYWQGNGSGQTIDRQDIFVCTHGMRDKCCAQFGQPLFIAAKRSVEQGKLPARVWKVSHIGGHRFAPTAISLPDGRYYGRLTLAALKAIATRSGPISQLRSVYRGWGLLPQPLQVLEQQLLLDHGWQWLTYEAAYRLRISDEEDGCVRAELLVRKAQTAPKDLERSFTHSDSPNLTCEGALSNSQITLYRAKIIQDAAQAYYVTASCGDTSPSTIVKYAVADCSRAEYSSSELP